MSDNFEKLQLSNSMNKEFEWRKWEKEIPYISFPSEYKIQIIPPTMGAIVRFRVSIPGVENDISVYLDCYDILGLFGQPYWEVYPYRGDIGRCEMQDTKKLLEMIADRSPGED